MKLHSLISQAQLHNQIYWAMITLLFKKNIYLSIYSREGEGEGACACEWGEGRRERMSSGHAVECGAGCSVLDPRTREIMT